MATTVTSSASGFVRQNDPNSAFNATYMSVGKSGSATQIDRTFLYFDFAAIPDGAIITSAKLYMYAQNSDFDEATQLVFKAGRITTSWNASTTYNTQPSYADAAVTGLTADLPSSDVWRNWDVVALVQEIIDGETYEGIYLMSEAESSPTNKRFYSATSGAKPYLSIEYEESSTYYYDGTAYVPCLTYVGGTRADINVY